MCRVEAAAQQAHNVLGANLLGCQVPARRAAGKTEQETPGGALRMSQGTFMALPGQMGLWPQVACAPANPAGGGSATGGAQPAALPSFSLLQPAQGADRAGFLPVPIDTQAQAPLQAALAAHAPLCSLQGGIGGAGGVGIGSPMELPGGVGGSTWWPPGMSMQGLVNLMVGSQIAAHFQHAELSGALAGAGAQACCAGLEQEPGAEAGGAGQ